MADSSRQEKQWSWKWGNLTNPGWRSTMKKNIRKGNGRLRICGTPPRSPQMHREHPRRGGGGACRKNIWKSNGPKSPKLGKRPESTHPRSSANPKQENLHEIQALQLYRQRQGETRNLKAATHSVQGIRSKIKSSLFIRSNRCRETEDGIFQVLREKNCQPAL